MRRSVLSLRPGIAALLFLVLSGCTAPSGEPGTSDQNTAGQSKVSTSPGCTVGPVKEIDGQRRLALVVGVGQYKKNGVPDLAGPPNDARRFYALLTGKNGYGFPEENVCLLLDEQATTANFKHAFEQGLVSRARPDDVVVFFFAGHGSQVKDRNGDEPDEWDETLMLHDARTDDLRDLVDDEFNQMLSRLYQKTHNVTVVLDSCNSGTATRAPDAGTVMARFFTPLEDDGGAAATVAGTGDGGRGWAPEALPGLVVFSAATDSNPALEKDGRGIFTDALLKVMSQVGGQPLTLAQVSRQTPPLVAAESPQVPYFHGDLDKAVFGNRTRTRPIAWEVTKVGPPIELGGPPLPGIQAGAELRVYSGAATGADTRDPGKAKATLVIDTVTGLNARAHISAAKPGAASLQPGDLAVLARPADAFVTLKVRLRPAGEPRGIPKDRADKLRALIGSDGEAALLVSVTDRAGDFELSLDGEGQLVLRGPENQIRNTYAADAQVPRSLWQHARQRALLQLHGEGGADFVDNETLLVSLVEAPPKNQNKCARGFWVQAPPNSEQVIPLCKTWNVQVKLAERARKPVLIGALILSTDGGMFALPRDDRKVRLRPGETHTFKDRGETFMGQLPLDVQDRVIVFGTQETNPVSWNLFTETAQTRAATPAGSALVVALDRYLKPGTRGVGEADAGPVEDTTWTLSTVTMRVQANPGFLEGKTGQAINTREYTIASFDLRPYLPDSTDSALYKVLTKADLLARASAADGFSYKQHPWNKSTDEQNLMLGIDCSRSIWFAFTRAGLAYNRGDRYLTTAEMVGDNTPMKDQFDSCSNDPNLRTGDVLVYRDATRGDGHVVMVIDAEKRIAWGSHGWDGNPTKLPVEPDTGVEYQKIKYKPDWARWDRGTMTRKACWRYRAFAEERKTGHGLPGINALGSVCVAEENCGMN